MRHALPNVDLGVNACVHGSRDVAQSVVQQNFVIAHMNADRRQSSHVTVECGSPRSCGVSSTQIGADQFENLGFGEIRISRRPCLPTFPGECQVGYGRQRYSSDWNDTVCGISRSGDSNSTKPPG